MNKDMYQIKYNNWNHPCSCMPGALLNLITALYYETLVRIHKNEQLLDWPFTRLLLEALYIKTSN